jgi:hypothetical protein
MNTVLSLIRTSVGWALTGFTLVLFMLFVIAGVTLCMWILNWPVFVFAGTRVAGLIVSCAYLWLCVTFYEPYLTWYFAFKNDGKPRVTEVRDGVPVY